MFKAGSKVTLKGTVIRSDKNRTDIQMPDGSLVQTSPENILTNPKPKKKALPKSNKKRNPAENK